MSLKDAIRQAVDERDNQAKGEDTKVTVGEDPLDTSTTNEASDQKPKPIATAPRSGKQAKKPVGRARTVSSASETPISSVHPNTASSKTVNTASSTSEKGQVNTDEASEDNVDVEMAALTVRVPRAHRLHWLISAKKDGTSLTAAITEALNSRFGEPTD